MEFANAVAADVLPKLSDLPMFAGAYLDQKAEGRLVVLLTELDPATMADIEATLPLGAPGIEFLPRSTTERELVAASRAAWSMWNADGSRLLSASVDLMTGQLVLGASEGALGGEVGQALADQLGVPVKVVSEEPQPDLHCSATSRDHCHAPMKAGILLHQGGGFTIPTCTMGFQIRVGSDEQFLSAGHCGHTGWDSWYHQGYGVNQVGSEFPVPLAYQEDGLDVMRVQLPDVEVSDDIYEASPNIIGSAWPLAGGIICASLGKTNKLDCGTVTTANTTWSSETCGCTVSGGGNNGIAADVGDSGSPMYTISGGGLEQATAIGMVNTLTRFVRVKDALLFYSASLVT